LQKIIVCIFIILAASVCLNANHFTPAWWGQNPYLAMNFFIAAAEVQGTALDAGDEIGIFDGSTLVGAALLTGPISSYQYQLLPINVSMTGGSVPGSATPGHFITFRLWIASSGTEYSYPEMSVFFDNENETVFETQGTCFINMISYSTPTGINTQTVTPPPGPGGGYVNNVSFPGTGVTINQMWINGVGGGPVTAYSFNTPTLDCTYNGTPPAYNPNYGWFIDTQYISYFASTEFPVTVSFSLLGLQNIGDPNQLILYRRDIHGTGPFTPVVSIYNQTLNCLTAQVTALGEFIIGLPTLVNQTGSLNGHVYEYDSMVPVPNTLVSIGSFTTLTDQDGYYNFSTLIMGFYDVYYEAAGFIRTRRNVSILANNNTTVDVHMVPDDMQPQIPQALSIVRISGGFRLDWDSSDIAQSYLIYTANEPYVTFQYLATTDMNFIVLSDSFLLDHGVNPDYAFFRVFAESELP
jgi:hypothetical protein